MSESKRSNFWVWITLVFLLIILGLIWALMDSRQDLANQKAADSVRYKRVLEIISNREKERDGALAALKLSGELRANQAAAEARNQEAYRVETQRLRRRLAMINISHAGVAKLDSIQQTLYGQVTNDSIHTIPLEYSRKLTGDALRRPILERLAVRAQERLDSATGHYKRILGEMTVDLEMMTKTVIAEKESDAKLVHQVGEMQAELNNKDRAFRRQRRKERIIEGVIIVGIIVLSL